MAHAGFQVLPPALLDFVHKPNPVTRGKGKGKTYGEGAKWSAAVHAYNAQLKEGVQRLDVRMAVPALSKGNGQADCETLVVTVVT